MVQRLFAGFTTAPINLLRWTRENKRKKARMTLQLADRAFAASWTGLWAALVPEALHDFPRVFRGAIKAALLPAIPF